MGLSVRQIFDFRFNSSVARRVLGCFYKNGNVYQIGFGPIRGNRLYYDQDINFHCMLGLWDLDGLRVLKTLFAQTEFWVPGFTVADVGANIGYMSMFFEKMTRPYGAKIYSFEPNPNILGTLKKNREINHGNFEIVQAAVTDRPGQIEFFLSHHHHTSSLVESWAASSTHPATKIMVQALTLTDFFAEKQTHPSFVKIDIEGGGVSAIPGLLKMVEKNPPFFYIESHTPDEDRAISKLAVDYNYSVFSVTKRKWLTHLSEIHPHPEGISGTMLLCPPKFELACRKLFRDAK